MAKARLVGERYKYVPVELTLETRKEFNAVHTLLGLADRWIEQALVNAGYKKETIEEVCVASSDVWKATQEVEQI